METYRSEVGHAHQVKPANIVGAIANESGLESRFIGRIEIFDDYSTVDLLAGMPPKVFQTLKMVKLSGRRLDISRIDEAPAPEDRPEDQPIKAPVPKKDRPAGQALKAHVHRKERTMGKKFKGKAKPKRATARS
jgi:ATP-dependent RNA helicase DeaD